MDRADNESPNNQDIEALYAKPMKPKPSNNAPSITSEQSEPLYDKLDRSQGNHISERSPLENPPSIRAENDDASSMMSAPRSIVSQSAQSFMSVEGSEEDPNQYPLEIIDTKDTNDLVRELQSLGLASQSERLVSVLRCRFDLEDEFITASAEDGVTIVEGDEDTETGHKSIGGLRVKGMKANYVNYDEYDPDIIKKYGHLDKGFSRENMASDAATLRRRAANMLWTVENMERMIDPNSRVRYVRQEEELAAK